MKRVVALVLTMAIPGTALAEGAPGLDCTVMGDLAENIMRARQNGVAPTLLVKTVTETLPEPVRPAMQNFVMSAYSIPRYSSAKYVERAVQDFRATTEVSCLQSNAASGQGE